MCYETETTLSNPDRQIPGLELYCGICSSTSVMFMLLNRMKGVNNLDSGDSDPMAALPHCTN